mgnify:CR=1 FL=1
MINTSKKLGVELPMIIKAEEIYKNAINEGLGNLDYTGIIEYIAKTAQIPPKTAKGHSPVTYALTVSNASPIAIKTR